MMFAQMLLYSNVHYMAPRSNSNAKPPSVKFKHVNSSNRCVCVCVCVCDLLSSSHHILLQAQWCTVIAR